MKTPTSGQGASAPLRSGPGYAPGTAPQPRSARGSFATDALEPSTGGRRQRWAFTNGESHTQLEDSILDKIDRQRGLERGLIKLRQDCERCDAEQVEVTMVRDRLVCTPCRHEIHPPVSSAPAMPEVARRGGPYYVHVPGEEKARLVHTDTQRQARDYVAGLLGRERLPKGTKVRQA